MAAILPDTSDYDLSKSKLLKSDNGSSRVANPRKTSRKQWSLQDGPNGLLRRMRSQLAQDGCPESQYILAKALLEEEAQEVDMERLAVFWLTQASLQGNIQATDLLQNCLLKNIENTNETPSR